MVRVRAFRRPGTPMPTAAIDALVRSCETRSSSAAIRRLRLSGGVDVLVDSDTAPRASTLPALIVVPPISIPI